MVSGDVFRPPPNATLLCVQVGSGVQIIASAFMTLFFAALGTSGCLLCCHALGCCLAESCLAVQASCRQQVGGRCSQRSCSPTCCSPWQLALQPSGCTA